MKHHVYMYNRKLPTEELVRLVYQGFSPKQIADLWGLDLSSVWERLVALDLPKNPRVSPRKVDLVCRLAFNGVSVEDVVSLTGIRPSVVEFIYNTLEEAAKIPPTPGPRDRD